MSYTRQLDSHFLKIVKEPKTAHNILMEIIGKTQFIVVESQKQAETVCRIFHWLGYRTVFGEPYVKKIITDPHKNTEKKYEVKVYSFCKPEEFKYHKVALRPGKKPLIGFKGYYSEIKGYTGINYNDFIKTFKTYLKEQ